MSRPDAGHEGISYFHVSPRGSLECADLSALCYRGALTLFALRLRVPRGESADKPAHSKEAHNQNASLSPPQKVSWHCARTLVYQADQNGLPRSKSFFWICVQIRFFSHLVVLRHSSRFL